MSVHFMLTGMPGCGKTTLVQRVVEQLGRSYDLRSLAAGFATEEVMGPGGREGFDVVSLDGRRAPLSRKETTPAGDVSVQPRPRVGRYLVDVPSFESIALPELVVRPQVQLYVIDEIGKMEFYSESFIAAVRRVLDSGCVAFGVVPYFREVRTDSRENPLQTRGRSFVKEICDRSDVRLVVVTRSNREALVQSLTQEILQSLSNRSSPHS